MRNISKTFPGVKALQNVELTIFVVAFAPVFGWMWLKMARAAQNALADGGGDADFHQAKLVTARFYAERELPLSGGLRRKIEAGAGSLMALSAEAF